MSESDMGVAKRGASADLTAQRPSASSGAERTLADSFEDLTAAVLNLKRDRDKLVSALRAIILRTSNTSYRMGEDVAEMAKVALAEVQP